MSQYARALQKYLQFQKIENPGQIEPVLISTDPGAHIESMRPVARVVQSDAIKQFAASLSQARPVLRPEQVYELAERIVNPLPPEANPLQPKSPEMEAEAAFQKPATPPPPVSRSQAIFNSEQKPFDPNDLGFAFEDEAQSASQEFAAIGRAALSQRLPSQSAKGRKIMGMTTAQIVLLAVMLIVECCS